MSNISILIVEDEGIVAHDIARRVKKLGYDVAAIKHKGEFAINWLELHNPDLILCDINIKGEKDGIDVAQYVCDTSQTPLVFITALSDRVTLNRAKKTLPYGYIVKPFDTHDLLTAIELALYKHSVEIEKLAITLDKINAITTEDVKEREYEMLLDIISGLTNQQIAESRHISVATVKYHVGKLLQKMEASNRASALLKIIKLFTKSQ